MRASDMLASGLASLVTELGEPFALGVTEFVGVRDERDRDLPHGNGVIRETIIHVARIDLPVPLPAVGSAVTMPGGGLARLARYEPSALPGRIKIIVADSVT